ncbi:MAG: HPr family phosphocarrier protein [Pseudomonadota bacterium]
MNTESRSLQIVNQKGLHARASAKFVEVVEAYGSRCLVSKDAMEADGDSIMSLLMLAAERGSTIQVEINGPDAAALADALEALVADKFGEEN